MGFVSSKYIEQQSNKISWATRFEGYSLEYGWCCLSISVVKALPKNHRKTELRRVSVSISLA